MEAPVGQLRRQGHVKDGDVYFRRRDFVAPADLLGADVEVLSRPLDQLHRLRRVAVNGKDDAARHGSGGGGEGRRGEVNARGEDDGWETVCRCELRWSVL